MELKTSKSYQEAVLKQYKNEQGGEMSFYLAQPTPSQIREACLSLLEKRKSKHDQRILHRFFQFENEENRFNEIQKFDGDKFKPVVNFLKGGVKKTHVKNIELISWLIDFKPRPYQEYIRPEASIVEEDAIASDNIDEPSGVRLINLRQFLRKRDKLVNEQNKLEANEPRRRRITISISVAFGILMFL
ncbi:hypothetical protein [Croceitalea sp. P059]|uniref:hypothetical protein n=1 Tax=Croceitalea sp. P059 TaxID=3075601 RepID=UPI002885D7FC|nr:hypothetical protein [Croceitalea sp. P059]MDT0539078.1 hypothetical protein [Croceitalea sp. P059]